MNKVDWGTRTREEANMSGRHELNPRNTHLPLPYPYSAMGYILADIAVFLELTCTLIKGVGRQREANSSVWIHTHLHDLRDYGIISWQSLSQDLVRTGWKSRSLHSFPIIFTENIRLSDKEIDFKFYLFTLIHRIIVEKTTQKLQHKNKRNIGIVIGYTE